AARSPRGSAKEGRRATWPRSPRFWRATRPTPRATPERCSCSWHAERNELTRGARGGLTQGAFPGPSEGKTTMADKVKTIWFEGELVAWDEAKVHLLTHTMHYGLGAFEGIRAYRRADGSTTIFRLKEHIDRLFDTCKLVMIEPRFSRDAISSACSE